MSIEQAVADGEAPPPGWPGEQPADWCEYDDALEEALFEAAARSCGCGPAPPSGSTSYPASYRVARG